MSVYRAQEIESKWQTRWEESDAFRVDEAREDPFYCLEMLPYPSGRIHMGHVRNYSIGDAIARFRRMRGSHVMHVMGWDSFGLPAENAAIERGVPPRSWTADNIEAMRVQFKRLGLAYDWRREISTCDPDFYRWNQWFFLRMLERDLVYRAKRLLNWCDGCTTVLANEQVVNGRCWRCNGAVTRREFDQWFARITRFAGELLDELDGLEQWPERVRTMQRYWIGRSHGTQVEFGVDGSDERLEVFTTRVDTIFGATYVALAAEHPMIEALIAETEQRDEVRRFVDEQLGKSLEDRFAEGAAKLGVFTGRHAINPYNGERIPIWVANFVLTDVGTGAIMSVPAHDQRDFEFAQSYGLPRRPVIRAADGEPLVAEAMTEAFPDDGVLQQSGSYDGMTSADARAAMTADADAGGFGRQVTTFRLKDWGLSRQRFWGTPIPIIYCDGCGTVPVPDAELPVELPEDAPLTGSGGSPLARVDAFVHVPCPACGQPARRETDTMDTFVDSSWYYFRYLDPRNREAPFGSETTAPWLPVDLYIGGIEHATLHLIYTRFWTKMMRELGLVAIDEPVVRLFTQGMVIKDGAKMSKSKGNVVDPDEMVDRYGADTTRLFSLFAAPPEKDLEWSEAGVEGCHRFLGRVWRTFEKFRPSLAERPAAEIAAGGDALALRRKTHKTIRRVTDALGDRMHLNTAIAAIMELINETSAVVDRCASEPPVAAAVGEAFESLALLMAPFAPHFAEELWEAMGRSGFVCAADWREADPALLVEEEVTLVVQVNGKVRAKLQVERGASEESALTAARGDARVAAHLEGKSVKRVIHVPDRLLNVVVQ